MSSVARAQGAWQLPSYFKLLAGVPLAENIGGQQYTCLIRCGQEAPPAQENLGYLTLHSCQSQPQIHLLEAFLPDREGILSQQNGAKKRTGRNRW